MKSYLIKKLIYVNVALLLILGSSLSQYMVAAITPRSSATTSLASTNLSFTSEQTDNKRIAVLPGLNMPADLYVSSNSSGYFDFVSKTNSSTGVGPFTSEDTEGYPLYVRSYMQTDTDGIRDPWDVEWLWVDNNTDLDGSQTVSLTASIYQLGNLTLGQLTEFENPIPGLYLELQINVYDLGLYLLYFDSDTTLSSIRLINPDNNQVSTNTLSLPTVSSTGNPIRRVISFMPNKAGVYRFYFKADTKHFTMELQKKEVTKNIEMGDRVIYKDASYDEISPQTLMEAPSSMPVHIYKFNVSKGDVIYHTFSNVWGNPFVRLILPSPFGYSWYAIDTSDAADFSISEGDGTAYLVVINNQYFIWDNSFDPIRNLMYYRFSIDKVEKEPYTLSAGDTYLTVAPELPLKTYSFSLNESVWAVINSTIISGTPAFGLTSGWEDLTFFRWNESMGYTPISTIMDGQGANQFLYYFMPGDYIFNLMGSAGSLQKEVVKMHTEIINPLTNSVPIKNLNGNLTDDELTVSDKISATFDFYQIDGISTTGEYLPIVAPINFNNNILFYLNTSLEREDNDDLFRQKLPDYQIWIWNGSEYINQTYSATAQALFVNGTADDHPVYIGATDKFNRVALDIETNGSIADEYVWEFSRFGAWNNLALTEDSTAFNNTFTMNKSGEIYFGNINNWDFVSDPYDPGLYQDMPDVNQSMYWIRLRCTTATPQAIPVLKAYSVTDPQIDLYRYMDVDVNLNVKVYTLSEFDGVSLTGIYSSGAISRTINDDDTNLEAISSLGYVMTNQPGFVIVWPYNVNEANYSTGAEVRQQTRSSLTFRIGAEDYNNAFLHDTFSISANTTSVKDLTDLNYTTFTGYNYRTQYNASEYFGILLDVSNSQMYDWYQFVLNTINATTASVQVDFIYDNVWTSNNGPATSETDSFIVWGVGNTSFERGVAPSSFKVIIYATNATNDQMIYLNLSIGAYHTQIFTWNSLSYNLPPLQESTPESQGLPSWVLPTAIGSGIAIAATVGFVIYKKKHPV